MSEYGAVNENGRALEQNSVIRRAPAVALPEPGPNRIRQTPRGVA